MNNIGDIYFCTYLLTTVNSILQLFLRKVVPWQQSDAGSYNKQEKGRRYHEKGDYRNIEWSGITQPQKALNGTVVRNRRPFKWKDLPWTEVLETKTFIKEAVLFIL